MKCWKRKISCCFLSNRGLNREFCQLYRSWKEVENLLNGKGKCGKKCCGKKK